jgi:pyruvate dehydrogenase E2 component (dihydrolipoyllysine-residue acetyltransferase)
MAIRIVVPDAGQTTDEMLLAKWYVRVGDKVEAGDFLADIETDKAVAELESYAAGHVLKLMVEAGDTVRTGQTLLWLGEPGEPLEDEVESAEAPRKAPDTRPEAPPAAASVAARATPAARAVARERGIDLATICGTAPNGCIVKRDVLAAGRTVPLSAMRRAIAARLQQSVREAPQFHLAIDVDMTHALAARERHGHAVTVNDLLVKAAADTLARFPQLNCRLEGEAVRYLDEVSVGIAVSVDEGLVVPVLARADQLSLAEVAQQSRRLIDGARAGRLPTGAASSLTVSNLGMYGVKWFTAIINPPEVAILAAGAVGDKLVLTETGVVAVPSLALTLSCDHRIIDGVLAARFLQALKDRLESPDAWDTPPREVEDQ